MIFLWAHYQAPSVSFAEIWIEYDFLQTRTSLFASFSGKDILRLMVFLGARPQTPRVGFAEVWTEDDFLRSRTTLFASFSGKRRYVTINCVPQNP
jgi:hypothetical protein